MINGYLDKVRIWTVIVATALALALLSLRGGTFALGVWGAAIWAVLGFWIVEHLVRQALLPRETPRNVPVITSLVVLKFGLYGLGFWVLKNDVVPPLSCFIGFTILLAVLVAAALMIQPKLMVQPTQRFTEAAGRGNDD